MTALTARAGALVRRTGVALGARLAPGLAARLAADLWFTVPPSTATPVREPALPHGDPLELTAHGCLVRGTRWGSGPVVYLVHGWGGNRADLAALVAPLIADGFTVVAYDSPAHGASGPGSGGPRTHAVEMGRLLGAVVEEHGPAHAVVAHSLGAVATMLALRAGWLTTDRLVLLAPIADVRDALDAFARHLGLPARVRTRLDLFVQGRSGLSVGQFALAPLAARIGTPDVLVVHDLGDRRAPYATTLNLADGWPAVRLVTTEGLGHRRILRDPRVVDEVVGTVGSARRAA